MPLAVIVVILIAACVLWGLVRLRAGRAAIRTALERDGYSIVTMHRSLFRQGPLFWSTTPSQIVYRVQVRESSGRQRTVWARWGRSWLPKPDAVDFKWEE